MSITQLPSNITNSMAYSRLVSAEIRVTDNNPVSARTGTLFATVGTQYQMTHPSATLETLRNMGPGYSVNVAEVNGARSVALPIDRSAELYSGLHRYDNGWATPIIIGTNVVVGGQFLVDVVVNYEYIPAATADELAAACYPEKMELKSIASPTIELLKSGWDALMSRAGQAITAGLAATGAIAYRRRLAIRG